MILEIRLIDWSSSVLFHRSFTLPVNPIFIYFMFIHCSASITTGKLNKTPKKLTNAIEYHDKRLQLIKYWM